MLSSSVFWLLLIEFDFRCKYQPLSPPTFLTLCHLPLSPKSFLQCSQLFVLCCDTLRLTRAIYVTMDLSTGAQQAQQWMSNKQQWFSFSQNLSIVHFILRPNVVALLFIPALRRPRQEDCWEFQSNMSYLASYHLKQRNKNWKKNYFFFSSLTMIIGSLRARLPHSW